MLNKSIYLRGFKHKWHKSAYLSKQDTHLYTTRHLYTVGNLVHLAIGTNSVAYWQDHKTTYIVVIGPLICSTYTV